MFFVFLVRVQCLLYLAPWRDLPKTQKRDGAFLARRNGGGLCVRVLSRLDRARALSLTQKNDHQFARSGGQWVDPLECRCRLVVLRLRVADSTCAADSPRRRSDHHRHDNGSTS